MDQARNRLHSTVISQGRGILFSTKAGFLFLLSVFIIRQDVPFIEKSPLYLIHQSETFVLSIRVGLPTRRYQSGVFLMSSRKDMAATKSASNQYRGGTQAARRRHACGIPPLSSQQQVSTKPVPRRCLPNKIDYLEGEISHIKAGFMLYLVGVPALSNTTVLSLRVHRWLAKRGYLCMVLTSDLDLPGAMRSFYLIRLLR